MNTFYKVLFLIAFSLVYTSCSEKADPEISQQEAATHTLYKSTLNQGEVGLILTDQSIASISATLNSETLSLTNTSEGYGFVVPVDLAMGSYTLNIIADEQPVDFTLTVREVANIPDPDQYINKTLEDIDTKITDAGESKSKLPLDEQASFQRDIETITGWIDQYKTAYDALTPEQKQVAAKTIEANKQNLEDLSTAIDNLNASTLNLKKAELDNHEAVIEDAMQEYTIAVISVARSTAVAGILAGGGFLTLGPFGAAIGAGIGVGLIALNFKRLSAAQSALLNNTFLPFENLLAKFKKSTLEFNSNEYTELSISANYRSINNGDLNSQTPIVNTFVTTAIKAKTLWDDLMNKLDVTMDYAATDITEVTATNSSNRDIHSANLEIENVSSPNISYDVDRSEGSFTIKFNSSEDYDEDFTFDLVYSNERFGYMKQEINAKFIAREPEPLSGRWISEAMSDEEADDTSDYKNYATIFNFTGMNCKCLSFQDINLNTNVVFAGESGYCIQKSEDLNKYNINAPESACPITGTPEGVLTIISKTENELRLRLVDQIDGEVSTFTLTPY